MCTGKYRFGWGVVVQLMLENQCTYFLADAPPPDHEDLRCLAVEERFGRQAKSPEELYRLLPTVYPQVNQVIRKARPEEVQTRPADGVFKIEAKADLFNAPRWPWDQIWSLATGEQWELQPKPKKKGKSGRR